MAPLFTPTPQPPIQAPTSTASASSNPGCPKSTALCRQKRSQGMSANSANGLTRLPTTSTRGITRGQYRHSAQAPQVEGYVLDTNTSQPITKFQVADGRSS